MLQQTVAKGQDDVEATERTFRAQQRLLPGTVCIFHRSLGTLYYYYKAEIKVIGEIGEIPFGN